MLLYANLGFKNTHEQANFQWRKGQVYTCFVKDITIEQNVIKTKRNFWSFGKEIHFN